MSSPGDAGTERRRTENVVSRLNGEFAGVARLTAVRWETEYYKAHATFQTQIPPADQCDIVVGILRWRLGTQLPPDFADHLPDGEAYPSGTAYEILTAIAKRRQGGELPDVFVFRYAGGAPRPELGQSDYDDTVRQWEGLRRFFSRWFVTPQGQFHAAFNSYNNEDDFEHQLETMLRKWLAEKVAGGRVVPWPATKGSPFRGLGVFGARHAPVFFGRAADTRRALDLLRDSAARGTRFLLIVGASGAGKSSLARSGLVPRLITPGVVPDVDLWRVAVMRPGDNPDGPFASLAAALLQGEADLPPEEEGRGPALPEIAEGDSKTPADLAAVLAHADTGAAKPITNALARIGERATRTEHYGRAVRCDLVLLVDQLDELFSIAVTDEVRARFGALLTALVASGRVWLVATLRADLYAPMLAVPVLKALKDAGASYDLTPPGAAELAEIVREPAKAAALTFERDPATGERLDERLLREADRPDMLPLVQLALSRLWEARETNGADTVLSFAAFEKLGGVKGIVEEAGETALAGLGETERGRLPQLVRRLAELSHRTSHAAGALNVRAVPLAEAAPDPATRTLVDALVGARLLTLAGEGGAASVRLTHQRVLTDWTRAAKIVTESADFYRVREEVEDQRQRWAAGERRREFLLARGLPLAEARAMAAKYGGELPPETHAFIAASRRRANRAQAMGWAAAAVFAVVALGAGVAAKVALDQQAKAERNFAAAKRTVDGLVFNIAQGLEDVAGMRVETTRKILETARRTADQLLAAAPDDPQLLRSHAAMLGKFAKTYQTAGDLKDALAAATESLATSRKLAARDPAMERLYVSVSLETLGDLKLKAGDQAGALAAFQEMIAIRRKQAAQHPGDLQSQRDVSSGLSRIGDVKLQAGDQAGALAAYQESLDIARKVAAQTPGNAETQYALSLGLQRVGDVKLQAGDQTGARAAYQDSLDIDRKLAAQDPDNARLQRGLATGLDKIGDVKLQAGDLAGALAGYSSSLDIGRKLAAQDPGDARRQRDVSIDLGLVGDVKLQAGDQAGALAAYQAALDILRKLAARDPRNAQARRDLSVGLNKLGDVKLQAGDQAGALAARRDSLGIRRALAAQDPGNADAQRDLSVGLTKIGDVELQAGDRVGALTAFEEGLGIARKLAAQDRGNAQAQRDVSIVLGRIGDAKLQAGDRTGALAAYQEDLGIARTLASQDAGNASAQRDLSISLDRVGNVKLQAVDPAGALAVFQESLEIRRKLAAQDPGSALARRHLSVSLDKIGAVKLKTGDRPGALTAFQERLELARQLAAQDAGNAQVQRGLAIALERMGGVKLQAGDQAGAMAAYQEDLAITRKLAAQDPGNAEAQRDLAITLNEIGTLKLNADDKASALIAYEEELEITRKLAEKTPSDAAAKRNVSLRLQRLAIVKKLAGDRAGSLAAYEENLGLLRGFAAADPIDAQAQRDLAAALKTIGDLKRQASDRVGALAAYQDNIGIVRALASRDPADGEAQWNVAVALMTAAPVADDPAALYREALAICETLDHDGKLAANRKFVLDALRKMLASKLPSQ